MGAGGEATAVRVARNAALLVAATILSRLAIFALGVAIARELGAGDYGRYGVALALATVLGPLADLGATPYIAREAARAPDGARAIVPTLLRTRVALVLALVALVAAVGWPLLEGDLLAVIVVVLVAQLLEGLARFAYGYFQGRERMGFEAATTTAAAFARSIGGIALLLVTGALLPVVVWFVAVSAAQVAVAVARLARAGAGRRPRGTRRARVDWRAVTAMGAMAIFVMIYLRADTVMVAWLLDERDAGWYTAAYTLMASLQIAPWMLAAALAPVFARTFARDAGLFERSWHEGIKAVLVVSLPLALTMSVLADPLIERIFGAAFEPSAGALTILAWATPLAALNVVATAVMRGAGRERALTVVSAGGAALNVGVNLWAIPAFGIEGAAAVTVTTETAVFALIAGVAAARGVVPLPRLPYARLAAALAALAAVAVALAATPLPVEAAVAGALAAYAAVLLASGAVGRGDLALLRAAAARRAYARPGDGSPAGGAREPAASSPSSDQV